MMFHCDSTYVRTRHTAVTSTSWRLRSAIWCTWTQPYEGPGVTFFRCSFRRRKYSVRTAVIASSLVLLAHAVSWGLSVDNTTYYCCMQSWRALNFCLHSHATENVRPSAH